MHANISLNQPLKAQWNLTASEARTDDEGRDDGGCEESVGQWRLLEEGSNETEACDHCDWHVASLVCMCQ
jgi:hypothetical protein